MPILPDYTLRLLDERPPLCFGRLTWAVAFALGPLIRRVQAPWVRRKDRRLSVLLDGAGKCQDRGELVRLLGTPQYAISGKHFGCQFPGRDMVHPDRVECYKKDGSWIEISFRNAKVMQISGSLKPSAWDIAAWCRARDGRPTPPAR
ncbi:MAG: hypothetical protein ACLQNE_46735 [Thermoguttaceae bacterium]